MLLHWDEGALKRPNLAVLGFWNGGGGADDVSHWLGGGGGALGRSWRWPALFGLGSGKVWGGGRVVSASSMSKWDALRFSFTACWIASSLPASVGWCRPRAYATLDSAIMRNRSRSGRIKWRPTAGAERKSFVLYSALDHV